MIKISKRQQKILSILLKNTNQNASQTIGLGPLFLFEEFKKNDEEISLITIKRELSKMKNIGLLNTQGEGRSHAYNISAAGRVFADINAHEYCSVEPDKRFGMRNYNFDLLSNMPTDIFSDDELGLLESATVEYKNKIKDISPTIQKKELERLIIELSWKSSKIEGNTYTLLDTEKLILENKEAVGHDKKEAQMILNHKEAFNFIKENSDKFKVLNMTNLEKLHSILVKNLGVESGLRKKPVGVLGSVYKPLDNQYQINDAINSLSNKISEVKTPYEKSMLGLLGISYIQPFEDGNKRTGRLLANAFLLSYHCAPLSYRSIDENEYRDAILVFYEINSIVPFKKIFIEQYDFATKNYTIS